MAKGYFVTVGNKQVRYSLLARIQNEGLISVYFRDPSGKRVERSTGEKSMKRAVSAAADKIRACYDLIEQEAKVPVLPEPIAEPIPEPVKITWDEAIDLVKEKMDAQNLRGGTIGCYFDTLNTVRRLLPDIASPLDLTVKDAQRFKEQRMKLAKAGELAVITVANGIRRMTFFWNKWFIREAGICENNPWKKVSLPKVDKKKPRVLSDNEFQDLLNWFEARHPNWRMPQLLLTVKALLGCRIAELCSLPTANLIDGRVRFSEQYAKGRKSRDCALPPEIFAELQARAGKRKFVWQTFPQELGDALRARKRRRGKYTLPKDFSPARLVAWVQNQLKYYRDEKGIDERTLNGYFKLHNFRSTAISKAHSLGIGLDDAAIAFGVNPMTIRQHYLAQDEGRVADDVFSRLNSAFSVPVAVPAIEQPPVERRQTPAEIARIAELTEIASLLS